MTGTSLEANLNLTHSTNAASMSIETFIALDLKSYIVLSCSDSIALLLKAPPENILGSSALPLFDIESQQHLQRQVTDLCPGRTSLLTGQFCDQWVEILVHKHDRYAYLELQNRVLAVEESVSVINKVNEALDEILSCRDLKQISVSATEELISLLHFDFASIYKIDQTGSARLLYESQEGSPAFCEWMNPSTRTSVIRSVSTPPPLFLLAPGEDTQLTAGLHTFMATPIPQADRDMLRELGVEGVVLIPLFVDSQTWGTIVCFSRAARGIRLLDRQSCDVLGRAISCRIEYVERLSRHRDTFEVEKCIQNLVTVYLEFRDWNTLLSECVADLLHLAQADGIAIVEGQNCFRSDLAPLPGDLQALTNWIYHSHGQSVFVTDRLAEVYPEAALLAPKCVGVACVTLLGVDENSPPTSMVWLRSKSPDSSEERSMPWTAQQIGNLKRLQKTMTKLMYRQFQRKQAEATQFAPSTNSVSGLGILASGVAHDFNQILTEIRSRTEWLMRSDVSQNVTAARTLHEILSISDRGSNVVQKLLQSVRQRDSSLQKIDLSQLIKDLKALIEEYKPQDVELEVSLDQELWPVLGNHAQIHQALIQIYNNSREALPHGGVIRISARNNLVTDRLTGLQQRVRPGRYVVVTVTDTGYGMPQEILPRIFEPFFSTKSSADGTGLGLTIVAGILQAHRGYLDVVSVLGHGTSISLYLPADHKAGREVTSESVSS